MKYTFWDNTYNFEIYFVFNKKFIGVSKYKYNIIDNDPNIIILTLQNVSYFCYSKNKIIGLLHSL